MCYHNRVSSSNDRRDAARALLLLCALVPSLMFFGHWGLSVEIPGTAYRIGKPPAHGLAEHEHDQPKGDHESHCHESAASCSDSPPTAFSWFGDLSEAMDLIGTSGLVHSVALRTRLPLVGRPVRPELPPPNPSTFG